MPVTKAEFNKFIGNAMGEFESFGEYMNKSKDASTATIEQQSKNRAEILTSTLRRLGIDETLPLKEAFMKIAYPKNPKIKCPDLRERANWNPIIKKLIATGNIVD